MQEVNATQERNMKWKLTVYKQDRRCKSGERVVYKNVYDQVAEQTQQDMIRYFAATNCRAVFEPATKIVKNLMTGKEIEIDSDTPRCCDPSSELYWSM